MMPVLVMVLLILPFNMQVETISVNQESTQRQSQFNAYYIQTILSGMVRAVLLAVHVGSFNSPPYLTKQLPSPTTDDIEASICLWELNEDTSIARVHGTVYMCSNHNITALQDLKSAVITIGV